MRSDQDVMHAIDEYGDTVNRICFLYLKNKADTEDIFQNVFMKYALNEKQFLNKEHKKAWFIRVTINECKDLLKKFFNRKAVSLEDIKERVADLQNPYPEVLEAVLQLPEKYKNVIYLHYYEGYTAQQISQITKKNVNTVYTLLTRGKKMLKEKLGGNTYA